MLEFVEQVIDSRSIEEVYEILRLDMETYGFSRVLYGLTRFRTARSFGDPNDLLILTNHDPVYVDKFLHSGLYFHAPMVRWSAENVGACSWSWLQSRDDLTDTERKIVEINHLHGVRAGYSVSFPGHSTRSKAALGMCGAPDVTQEYLDGVWAEHGREIVAKANIAHMKILHLPHYGSRKALTMRQREVLEWVGDGKTTNDIAAIMGLTQATVEKHLRLAREALDVETTAQAVLKASIQNQIFVVEM